MIIDNIRLASKDIAGKEPDAVKTQRKVRNIQWDLADHRRQPNLRCIPLGSQRCVRQPRIILAGLVTAYLRSPWRDLTVGIRIALLNADAAREIYTTALPEHRTALL